MAFYNRGKFLLARPTALTTTGDWDWVTQVDASPGRVFVALILTGSTNYALLTNNVYADFSADEITVGGYTAGGEALPTGATVDEDDANNRAEMHAPDLTFLSLAGAQDIIAVCWYIATSRASATNDAFAFQTHATTTTDGGDIIYSWNAQGLMQVTS